MKKIATVFTAILLAAAMLLPQAMLADQGAVFTMNGTDNVPAGGTFDVTLSVSGEYAIHAAHLSVEYDPNSLEIVGLEELDVMKNLRSGNNLVILDYETLAYQGKIKLGIGMPTDAMNAKGDIFKMTFKVKDGVSVNQQIVMIVNEFVNAPVGGESTPQAFTTHNAIITISGAKDPEGGFNRGEEAVGDNRQVEPPRRRKKKKKTPLWLPFAVVMAVIAVVSGVVVYGVSMLNKVEDSLRPDDSTPTIQEEVKTAEEYKGDVVNILVCGIDYEEGRNYSDASSNDGMTDMILYCQFDIKNGALHMLQIPRNSLVATQNRKITLSNGKTYAASNYQINSVALSNGGSIAALADVIYDQYRLPVDYYVSVDMQALVEMVDNFGGIEVYIPHDMSYGGSKLIKGYRNLDGASAEFFVRCRHGDGYANSDIDRLNMQRYFYAGLFKRARSMGVTDILNQLPLVFKNYIKTDMDISTIAKLVVSFLKIDSSNIILAQTPVFMGVPNVGKTDSFNGYSCVVPDAGSIAALLNQYFCTYTGPIDVSEMHLVTDQWPHGTASTDANVQYMGRIDKESDDAILNGNTDLSGAVTTDGQAAGSAN